MMLKQTYSQFLESADCVQKFDDSQNSAIHITYRISLRSSSLREPRDPLLKVVFYILKNFYKFFFLTYVFDFFSSFSFRKKKKKKKKWYL